MWNQRNHVLILLHTVSRSCKSLVKHNCSRSQNAAVEVLLALWSVLTIMHLVTGKKVCTSEKKVLLYMDLDELFSATKQQKPDDGTQKPGRNLPIHEMAYNHKHYLSEWVCIWT